MITKMHVASYRIQKLSRMVQISKKAVMACFKAHMKRHWENYKNPLSK
jgi:hypothetical protein